MIWKKYILFLCYYFAVVHSEKYYADLMCVSFDRRASVQNVYRNVNFVPFRLKFKNTEIDGQNHHIIPAYNFWRLYAWAVHSENHRSKFVRLLIELSTFARNTYSKNGTEGFDDFFIDLNAVRYNVSSGHEISSDVWQNMTNVMNDHGRFVCELFSMMPFNLVAGPKKLCSDSGAQLYTDFQFIVGRENYSNLKRINEEVKRRNVGEAIDLLLETIKNTIRSTPFDYNEHNWRYIGDKDCYEIIGRHHSRHRGYIYKSLDDEMYLTSMSKYAYTTADGTMGNETDHGYWASAYEVQFPFSIDGKQYFCGHSAITGYWFIQELLPGGMMGPETDHGYRFNTYDIQFPFSIDGEQYFYAQRYWDNSWFIQELLPGGKMGNETYNGNWNHFYEVQFPFSINGQQFFYAQHFWDDSWFIQELLPGGKMGKETDSGYWRYFYGVQFPFSVDGKQYFYGQHLTYDNWFIQELLPGGKMGEETDSGYWSNSYQVQFPFSINGQQFFYGQSWWWGNWFIQKLSPDGKMGEETNKGSWRLIYQVQFPFSIDGRQFFYGQSNDIGSWFIQEIL